MPFLKYRLVLSQGGRGVSPIEEMGVIVIPLRT